MRGVSMLVIWFSRFKTQIQERYYCWKVALKEQTNASNQTAGCSEVTPVEKRGSGVREREKKAMGLAGRTHHCSRLMAEKHPPTPLAIVCRGGGKAFFERNGTVPSVSWGWLGWWALAERGGVCACGSGTVPGRWESDWLAGVVEGGRGYFGECGEVEKGVGMNVGDEILCYGGMCFVRAGPPANKSLNRTPRARRLCELSGAGVNG